MFYISIFIILAIIFILFNQRLKIKNDINKVADMILYYQNNNVNNIENIINHLKEEENKIRSTFYMPEDMKITNENNEFIIYYKNLIYNINSGKYLDKKMKT